MCITRFGNFRIGCVRVNELALKLQIWFRELLNGLGGRSACATPNEGMSSNWLPYQPPASGQSGYITPVVLGGPQSLARGGVENGYLLGCPHVDKGATSPCYHRGSPMLGGDKIKNGYITQATCLVGPHVGKTGIACMLTLGMRVFFEGTN